MTLQDLIDLLILDTAQQALREPTIRIAVQIAYDMGLCAGRQALDAAEESRT